ncbi:MAG: hypothetical protein A3J74_03005 [Elusimicrobia bacterium RIFCSPHIGHO2_02_FULL_57_9]|nr:MAG: hypothetical protein A3J74_03005 [Elusimicrobia bacterium RIFCSPHIGHO2_02_FULL_57_9]
MTFSPDYVTARTQFREAVKRLGWIAHQYPIAGIGPRGEDLSIDVAASAPPATQPVLIISSGLHGVEGFLGSAVQLALLERWKRQKRLPEGLRCVLLHALNPHGFSWSRRSDADNIDLNRNFLLNGMEYNGDCEAYARFDGFLNPQHPPSRWDMFYLKASWLVARYGLPALKQALVTGQHDFTKGLFFAGKGPSQTKTILQEHMKSWIGSATTVVHLDFHAGLGAWGTYKLIIDYPLSSGQQDRLTRWFGAQAWEESDAKRISYQPRGSLGHWCTAQNFAPEYLFAAVEFGTYSNIPVIAGLRAENQAHQWGRPDDPRTTRAKKQLRELFSPVSEEWRSRALAQSFDLVEKAIDGVLGEAEPT